MSNQYHYYGVKGDQTWHFASTSSPKHFGYWQPALIEQSDLVWCQGPQGGVRFVYQNWGTAGDFKFRKHGYITTDPAAMQEFMWIKLRATDISVK
jgi:hypothetical protein